MADTQPQDVSLIRGTLLESKPDMIVLALPGTSYRLHLAVDAPVTDEVGKPVEGRIIANAKRIDVIRSGGRYVEPVYGRPRRLQGRISDISAGNNTLTVFCGCPFVCTLTTQQRAGDFIVGQLVSFDVERGAKFEQASAAGASGGGRVMTINRAKAPAQQAAH